MTRPARRKIREEVAATDFEKLYQTYYMQVYSYAMSLTKNAARAEEIAQQTFVKAMTAGRTYRGDASERTYLCAIAKNLAVDGFREEKRRAPFPEEAPPDETDHPARVADHDTALRIHLVLHHLNEPYKEVFSLRVFGELSFADIGRVFGKSENWARVTYHRAKRKIQERMAENE
ncbi:Sigma-70 region 2 [Pseudoramibacter alactolyticus ATCC 23263]|uniref:RNA polymerase sigma factor n=1 Tax=Pseudoramibacter alactolyticus ATCC 23263 TaxID=887929 RepID=E6MKD1_9FIRM|nr:Sigma-70 region 2 [Pseudoramibacter alactolyticus ATCC 23263]